MVVNATFNNILAISWRSVLYKAEADLEWACGACALPKIRKAYVMQC
jgi:hypothetical protein